MTALSGLEVSKLEVMFGDFSQRWVVCAVQELCTWSSDLQALSLMFYMETLSRSSCTGELVPCSGQRQGNTKRTVMPISFFAITGSKTGLEFIKNIFN